MACSILLSAILIGQENIAKKDPKEARKVILRDTWLVSDPDMSVSRT